LSEAKTVSLKDLIRLLLLLLVVVVVVVVEAALFIPLLFRMCKYSFEMANSAAQT
jgi:hypothetical protein